MPHGNLGKVRTEAMKRKISLGRTGKGMASKYMREADKRYSYIDDTYDPAFLADHRKLYPQLNFRKLDAPPLMQGEITIRITGTKSAFTEYFKGEIEPDDEGDVELTAFLTRLVPLVVI